jgi:hypothetical protein
MAITSLHFYVSINSNKLDQKVINLRSVQKN